MATIRVKGSVTLTVNFDEEIYIDAENEEQAHKALVNEDALDFVVDNAADDLKEKIYDGGYTIIEAKYDEPDSGIIDNKGDL